MNFKKILIYKSHCSSNIEQLLLIKVQHLSFTIQYCPARTRRAAMYEECRQGMILLCLSLPLPSLSVALDPPTLSSLLMLGGQYYQKYLRLDRLSVNGLPLSLDMIVPQTTLPQLSYLFTFCSSRISKDRDKNHQCPSFLGHLQQVFWIACIYL